ncbi:MAG: hypothetical protein OEY11_13410 [Gammaproteobacteria bacterium]|nr:hypothetical protein [Gammaproteobacteria bacterium]
MIHRAAVENILIVMTLAVLNMGIMSSVYAAQGMSGHAPASTDRIYGKVTKTMDAAGYTYAEVDTGSNKFWGAARSTALNVGDMIAFSTEMPMNNHYSKTLNREFSVVYFVNRFITDKEPVSATDAAQASAHANIKAEQLAAPIKVFDKIKGGNSIAEIYKNKADLKGKAVWVRGQVTKFTAKVMGKNWLHIRDSSTLDDLTVTSDAVAAVGDVVKVKGKLELDKDYNYGYVYPLIIVDAKVTK